MHPLRRIALFLRGNDDYQESLRDECIAMARRHRFEVRVYSTNDDVAEQLRQIDECLAAPENTRPAALLVQPVQELALASSGHAAARLNIGWVLLNRWSDYLTDLRREFPTLPIFSVSPDQHGVGRIQGQQFKSLMPYGGEVLYICGPRGASSVTRRLEGVQEALQGSPLRLSAVNSDWTTEGGERALKDWLKAFLKRDLPSFMVGAQNDAMAVGARRAFAVAMQGRPGPRHGVRFTGCDGSPSFGRRLVNEGVLAATVVIPPTTGRAVSELASMLGGGARPLPDIALAVSSVPDLPDLHADAQKAGPFRG